MAELAVEVLAEVWRAPGRRTGVASESAEREFRRMGWILFVCRAPLPLRLAFGGGGVCWRWGAQTSLVARALARCGAGGGGVPTSGTTPRLKDGSPEEALGQRWKDGSSLGGGSKARNPPFDGDAELFKSMESFKARLPSRPVRASKPEKVVASTSSRRWWRTSKPWKSRSR